MQPWYVNNKIRLTGVRMQDLDDLVKWLNDPQIYRNTLTIPQPYRRSDARNFIDRVTKFEDLNGFRKDWVVRHNDHGVIGGIGLLYEQGIDAHRSEMGFWLARDYRNKGIMTEVISSFVRNIFVERSLVRIDAHVFTDNPASARTLEKAGFRKEGLLKKAYLKNENYRDAWLYAVLPEYLEEDRSGGDMGNLSKTLQ